MADFADELKTHIQGLSTAAGNDVYHDEIPQGQSLPCVVITESGPGQLAEHLGGAAGLAEATWHVYAYAATRAAANTLAEAIRAGTHRFSGTMGSTAVSNVTCEQYRDSGVERAKDGSYSPRYWTRFVYDIWHAIAAVTS